VPTDTCETTGDDPMGDLRKLLLSFDANQLAALGVTLDRTPDWEWLREMFVAALKAEGRDRASRGLQQADLNFQTYSIGISRGFMGRLARMIEAEFQPKDTPHAN
jgi:hypothetical protein